MLLLLWELDISDTSDADPYKSSTPINPTLQNSLDTSENQQQNSLQHQLDISKFTVLTRDEKTSSKFVKVNKTDYSLEKCDEIYRFKFKNCCKCSMLKYENQIVWKHDFNKYGYYYPKEINLMSDDIEIKIKNCILSYTFINNKWNFVSKTSFEDSVYRYFTITALDDKSVTGLSINDKSQFDTLIFASGLMIFTFKNNAKCVEVKYERKLVWQYDSNIHGDNYPKSIVYKPDGYVYIDFEPFYYTYEFILASNSWILKEESSYRGDGYVDKSEYSGIFTVVTADDLSGTNLTENNTSKYKVHSYFKDFYLYVFEPGVVCHEFRYKGLTVWKYSGIKHPRSICVDLYESVIDFEFGSETLRFRLSGSSFISYTVKNDLKGIKTSLKTDIKLDADTKTQKTRGLTTEDIKSKRLQIQPKKQTQVKSSIKPETKTVGRDPQPTKQTHTQTILSQPHTPSKVQKQPDEVSIKPSTLATQSSVTTTPTKIEEPKPDSKFSTIKPKIEKPVDKKEISFKDSKDTKPTKASAVPAKTEDTTPTKATLKTTPTPTTPGTPKTSSQVSPSTKSSSQPKTVSGPTKTKEVPVKKESREKQVQKDQKDKKTVLKSDIEIYTFKDSDPLNPDVNDTSKFDFDDSNADLSEFKFKDGVKCVRFKLDTDVWKYDKSKPNRYPKELYVHKVKKLIFAFFGNDSYTLYYHSTHTNKWVSVPLQSMGKVQDSEIKVITKDPSNNTKTKENDTNQYVFKSYGFGFQYIFKSGSRCIGLKHGNIIIWNYDSSKYRKNYPTVLYYMSNKKVVLMFGNKARLVNFKISQQSVPEKQPKVTQSQPTTSRITTPTPKTSQKPQIPKIPTRTPFELNLNVTKTTDQFDYSKDESEDLITYIAKQSYAFNKIAKKKRLWYGCWLCTKTKIIWEGKSDKEYPYKVILKGSKGYPKYMLMLPIDGDFVLYYRFKKDVNWKDITSWRLSFDDFRFFGPDKSGSKVREIYYENLFRSTVKFSFGYRFKDGFNCSLIKYKGETIWTHSNDSGDTYPIGLYLELFDKKLFLLFPDNKSKYLSLITKSPSEAKSPVTVIHEPKTPVPVIPEEKSPAPVIHEPERPLIQAIVLDIKNKTSCDKYDYSKDDSGKTETYIAKPGYAFKQVKSGDAVGWEACNNKYVNKVTLIKDDKGKISVSVSIIDQSKEGGLFPISKAIYDPTTNDVLKPKYEIEEPTNLIVVNINSKHDGYGFKCDLAREFSTYIFTPKPGFGFRKVVQRGCIKSCDCCKSECCDSDCCRSNCCKSECCNSDCCKSECCKSDCCKSDCCNSDCCRSNCCNSDCCNSDCCKSDCCKSDSSSDCCCSQCCDWLSYYFSAIGNFCCCEYSKQNVLWESKDDKEYAVSISRDAIGGIQKITEVYIKLSSGVILKYTKKGFFQGNRWVHSDTINLKTIDNAIKPVELNLNIVITTDQYFYHTGGLIRTDVFTAKPGYRFKKVIQKGCCRSNCCNSDCCKSDCCKSECCNSDCCKSDCSSDCCKSDCSSDCCGSKCCKSDCCGSNCCKSECCDFCECISSICFSCFFSDCCEFNCCQNTVIWEAKDESEYSPKVVIKGLDNKNKRLLIVQDSDFVVFERSYKEIMWRNITSNFYSLSDIKMYVKVESDNKSTGTDTDSSKEKSYEIKEMDPRDYAFTNHVFGVCYEFREGTKCVEIRYKDKAIWKIEEDEGYARKIILDLWHNEFSVLVHTLIKFLNINGIKSKDTSLTPSS